MYVSAAAAEEGSTGVHRGLYMEGVGGVAEDEFDWLRQRHGLCTFAVTAAWSRVCVGLSEGMDAISVLLWSLFCFISSFSFRCLIYFSI